jgi:hypothetical protein
MVLDFAKEAMKNAPFDQVKLKETLAWLNSMLCNKKREVKTLEEAIFYLKSLEVKNDK